MSRIVVTGMGIISALGNNLGENRESLRKEHSGIGTIQFYPTAYAGKLPAAEVPYSNQDLMNRISILPSPTLTRTSLLALIAAEEAISDAALSPDILSSDGTALVGATTVGGICLTEELFQDAQAESQGSAWVEQYDYASVTLAVQQRFGISGEVATINTACSSSANSIAYGARLIRRGLAQRAIVGGAESLAKFTINGFNALNILSTAPCAPFDRDRNGLNLGEGAAFLVLEKEEDLHGRKAYAVYSGFGNKNDAYHPSSISSEGDGPYLAMREAMESAGLFPADIGYINAHGTGTENNDETESRAMLRLFNQPPAFSSTKSYTGHTLGASGAIEEVYSVLKLFYQEVYGSLCFRNPIPSTGLVPVRHTDAARLRHVMSNSFGFGGNCSSLIFSSC